MLRGWESELSLVAGRLCHVPKGVFHFLELDEANAAGVFEISGWNADDYIFIPFDKKNGFPESEAIWAIP